MTCSREFGWTGAGWKFKILAWQETNRRWDGPIANSFRVENSLLPLTFSDPLNRSPSLGASPSSSSFHFCSFSSRFSSRSLRLLRLLFSSPCPPPPLAPTCNPVWSRCVSIQRPHNRLLAHSVFRFLVVRHHRRRCLFLSGRFSSFFHLFLIQPGQPCFCLLLVFFLLAWLLGCSLARSPTPRSPIDKGMRPCPFSTRRETRPRRQGGVKEETRGEGNGGGGKGERRKRRWRRRRRRRITRGVGKARGRQRGRHNDWPFLGEV